MSYLPKKQEGSTTTSVYELCNHAEDVRSLSWRFAGKIRACVQWDTPWVHMSKYYLLQIQNKFVSVQTFLGICHRKQLW